MSLPQNSVPDKNDSSTIEHKQQSLSQSTRAARLTGKGRSAVAVIGLQGPAAEAALASGFRPATDRPWSNGEIRYGRWQRPDESQSEAESVVVTPMSHHRFEIQCHGGPLAVARILDDLARFGVETIDQDHWPEPYGESILIDEARKVLQSCQTVRTAAVALDQVRGAMHDWADRQLNQINQNTSDIKTFRENVRDLLASARIGAHLAEPFRIVLAGPVNVGKSSLVNAIVGYERSIALDHHGTTRDVLHAETVIDGLPVRLSDTAGFRTTDDTIELHGMSLAQAALSSADLILRVREPGVDLVSIDQSLKTVDAPVLDVLNKVDLLESADLRKSADLREEADVLEPKRSEAIDFSARLATVATTGHGVSELIEAIAAEIGRGFPQPGQPVPVTQRQRSLLNQLAEAADVANVRRLLNQLVRG